MSGQFRETGIHGNKRQRLALIGQTSVGGGSLQQQGNLPPLDDPVIHGIKCNLITSSRIGLEPISQKFARIAFKFKRRMVMKFGEVNIKKRYQKLEVMKKGSNAVNECPFDIPLAKVKKVFHSLFRRIPKWHSIDFTDFTSSEGPFPWVCCGRDEMIGFLLDAISAECGESIYVQRFVGCSVGAANATKLTKFVHSDAPNLRHLKLHLLISDENGLPPMPLLNFAQALNACRKLRGLWILHARPEQFPPDFLSQVLTLPQLSDLLLGSVFPLLHMTDMTGEEPVDHVFVRRQLPDLPSFSIDERWLLAISRLTDFSMFKNMQHFTLMTTSDVEVLLNVSWRVVAEMRSPANVDLDYRIADVSWQNVFINYLPTAFKTGAKVERNLRQGLPAITTEEFEAGLATMPSFVQNALTAPDLANAPIKNNRYQKLEFSFSGGARITFKKYWPDGP